jgi:very-short-patch-repair endonuclease
MTKIFNQPKQKLLRQALRKMPVSCERKLWSRLRNKQLDYKFFRQFGIGEYIVDFYCPTLKLDIELDGATHCTKEEIKRDEIRDKYLQSLGIITKRYNNTDIKENFSEVIYDIQQTCEQLKLTHPVLPFIKGKGRRKSGF